MITLWGMIIEVRSGQFENASSSIDTALLGIFTDIRFVQKNASEPICEIVSGKEIAFINEKEKLFYI